MAGRRNLKKIRYIKTYNEETSTWSILKDLRATVSIDKKLKLKMWLLWSGAALILIVSLAIIFRNLELYSFPWESPEPIAAGDWLTNHRKIKAIEEIRLKLSPKRFLRFL